MYLERSLLDSMVLEEALSAFLVSGNLLKSLAGATDSSAACLEVDSSLAANYSMQSLPLWEPKLLSENLKKEGTSRVALEQSLVWLSPG